MRQLLNRQLWIAFGILAVAGFLVVFASCNDCFGRGGDVVLIPRVVEKNIELVAIVSKFSQGQGWRLENGRTIGDATASLDDGRTVFIAAETPGELDCTDVTVKSSCVMLANMFGDSVMWFAITETNGEKPDRVLELPSLVDMLDGGDRGVLANGWIVRLAIGTKKTCGDDAGTLRDFINSYAPDKSISKMNLITDEVDEVVCQS